MGSSRTFLSLDKKGRATLPEEVRAELRVGAGDLILLEKTSRGTFELVPAELVPREDLWHFNPEFRERLLQADAELKTGKGRRVPGAKFLELLEGWQQPKARKKPRRK